MREHELSYKSKSLQEKRLRGTPQKAHDCQTSNSTVMLWSPTVAVRLAHMSHDLPRERGPGSYGSIRHWAQSRQAGSWCIPAPVRLGNFVNAIRQDDAELLPQHAQTRTLAAMGRPVRRGFAYTPTQ
ncbi:hypothetical protein GCM10022240_14860 [Microbacterium kribbense]|uniref:Uncharacterized protein n=1 Tax=Microbacterium kribbense TaxID=433645 RepID=A0ABP7GG24_9MICO